MQYYHIIKNVPETFSVYRPTCSMTSLTPRESKLQDGEEERKGTMSGNLVNDIPKT